MTHELITSTLVAALGFTTGWGAVKTALAEARRR